MTAQPAATVIGRSVPASRSRVKVTGAGRFPPDYPSVDVLHAAVLRSDVAHARITSIDLSAAAAMPGVAAAATRVDLGLDDVVRHYGDVIAAVAAATEDEAEAALAAVEVTLSRLPVLADVRAAIDSEVRLDPTGESNVSLTVDHEYGDVDGLMDAADVVYEATYRTGRPTHCNLSRRTCVARIDEGGVVELMTSVDAPFFARRELAEELGVAPEQVRIVLPELLTSSFGGRTGINRQCEPIAARLAMLTDGRPVRLMYGPVEEFTAGTTRHATIARLSAAATASGDLLALEIDLLADHGPYPDFVSRIVLSASRDRPIDLYAPQSYRFRGRSVLTNNPQAGEMRGIGATQISFLLGIHMDELARRLGMDPVAFHLRNLSDVARSSLTECLERGRGAFGWDGAAAPGTMRGVGVGLGCHTTGLGTFHGPDRASAALTLRRDGRIEVSLAAPDSGQGNSTIWSQIVSQELSVPAESVVISAIDTATAPPDPWGSVASRSTYVVGAAVKAAAADLQRAVAAALAASGSGGGDPVALHEAGGVVGPVTVTAEAVTEANPPTFGAYFAEVDVDPDTGRVAVRRMVAALDVGFAVHPAQCRGQIEGAIAMGLEFALGAEVVVRDGVPESVSLVDYPVATTADMPEVDVILVEGREDTGPYGARGIGTPSLTPVMPAIANAVRDAIGSRPASIPMRPEDIHSVLIGS